MTLFVCACCYISRVPDQNGLSQICYVVEIYHSGLESSILYFDCVVMLGDSYCWCVLAAIYNDFVLMLGDGDSYTLLVCACCYTLCLCSDAG